MQGSSLARPDSRGRYLRFGVTARLEHLVTIVTFVGLCLTGLPQRFAHHAWARELITLMGGIEQVRRLHRALACALVALAVFHVGSRLVALARRKPIGAIVPGPADVRDAILMGLYLTGIRASRPRFDRYDFRQKFEYWAMVWGTLVMIGTGLAQWFPVVATRWIPGHWLPVLRIIHGGEALLAFFTIAIWHGYCVALSAEVFPLDLSMFTGRISEARMLHEHPLEYERLARPFESIPVFVDDAAVEEVPGPAPDIQPARQPALRLPYAEPVAGVSPTFAPPGVTLRLVPDSPTSEGQDDRESGLLWIRRLADRSRPSLADAELLDASLLVEEGEAANDALGGPGWWEAPNPARHRRLARSILDTDPCDMRELVKEASGWK